MRWGAAAKAAANAAVNVAVNGRGVRVDEGASVLDAFRVAGVTVPTLCFVERMPAATGGNCRLCLVEETGTGKLVAACRAPVAEGTAYSNSTPRVAESILAVLHELRNSGDHSDCATCPSNGECELQRLFERYGVKNLGKRGKVDASDDAVHRRMDLCVKCGRCVQACSELQGLNILGFAGRGASEHVAPTFDRPLKNTACIECGQCIAFCPTGALYERPEWSQVMDMLDSNPAGVTKVAIVAPAVRVAIGEELGLSPGSISTGQVVTALKMRLGFDAVFDVNFAADLTIVEEGTELLERLRTGQRLPLFTSCCPGWINYVEKCRPELIPNLSTSRSPQLMHGSIIKSVWARRRGLDAAAQVKVVSLMPCTAKKHEADLPQFATPGGGRDVDYVLTTRELGRMLRMRRIPLASLPPTAFDDPLGESSGAAALFGATGGVAEAAARTVYELASKQRLEAIDMLPLRGIHAEAKEARIVLPHARVSPTLLARPETARTWAWVPPPPEEVEAATAPVDTVDFPLRVAVVHGMSATQRLLAQMAGGEARYDMVEVMACEGGCIGGGGQPKSTDRDVLTRRINAIYSIDAASRVRRSHENVSVQRLYSEDLHAPGSAKARSLLHRTYENRYSLAHPIDV